MHSLLLMNSGLVRKAAALTLVLWLGGLSCLLGCAMDASAAPATEPGISTKTVSAMAEHSSPSGHECCRATKNGGDVSFTDTSLQTTDAMSCCPLLAGQSSDRARKSRVGDELSPALSAGIALPSLRLERHITPFACEGRQLDRGGTYLRCRVLLI